jgi:hypothetical protein
LRFAECELFIIVLLISLPFSQFLKHFADLTSESFEMICEDIGALIIHNLTESLARYSFKFRRFCEPHLIRGTPQVDLVPADHEIFVFYRDIQSIPDRNIEALDDLASPYRDQDFFLRITEDIWSSSVTSPFSS